MEHLPELTARQARFVAEYCALGNGSEAARRAGYSQRTAREMASENLTKPAIRAAIEARRAEYCTAIEITKGDVVGGILAAITVAREQDDASAMIRGCVELARLLGFYTPEVKQDEISPENAAMQAKFVAMTDDMLLDISRGQHRMHYVD